MIMHKQKDFASSSDYKHQNQCGYFADIYIEKTLLEKHAIFEHLIKRMTVQ